MNSQVDTIYETNTNEYLIAIKANTFTIDWTFSIPLMQLQPMSEFCDYLWGIQIELI